MGDFGMRYVTLLGLLLSCFGCGATSVTDAPDGVNAVKPADLPVRPNIIWIYTDDHAQQAISAYGSKVNRTPNIDRLAAEGAIFTQSFVCNSICGPARAAVLTGLHSHANGFMSNGNDFDGSQRTFPKLLQEAGYRTAVIGKWHLKSEPQGFDHWEVLPGQGHYYNPDFRTPNGKVRVPGYVTDIITDKAIDWLETSAAGDAPFMLMVQHKAPHRAWMPGPNHLNHRDGETIPEPPTLFDDYSNRTTAARLQEMTISDHLWLAYDLKMWTPEEIAKKGWPYNATVGRLDPEQRRAWDAAYAAELEDYLTTRREGRDLVRWKYQRYLHDYLRCIATVDDGMGEILDYLDDAGLAENTMVLYSSDQGFYLGEHGWYDKRWMYEESLRTPLVCRWPGRVAPGTRVDALVQNIDMAPTFLEIAGADPADGFHGESVVPLLEGQNPEWRSSIYYHYYQGAQSTHKVHRHRGVRTDRYKLIHYYTIDEWELFDLEKDPLEMKSVHTDPEYAAVRSRLEEELARLEGQFDVPPLAADR
ncbi:MAG: sulfatase [Planctomycetota bacterium]